MITLINANNYDLNEASGSPSFTRATPAWVADYEGNIIEIPSGTPCFEGARYSGGSWYNTQADGVTPISDSTLKGLLVEGTRTNSLLYSRDLTNGVWGTDANPVYNEIGIDGVANSACTLTDDSATVSRFVRQYLTIPNDSNSHSLSFDILKDTDESRFPEFNLFLSGGTALNDLYFLNTKTGAIHTFAGWSGGSSRATLVHRGGRDWWRWDANIINNSSGNTSLRFLIKPAISTDFATRSNATTGSIVVDGCQVELNQTRPSSPIFTTSAAVTRNAVVMSYPVSGNLMTNNTSGIMEWTPGLSTNGTVYLFGSYSDAGNYMGIIHDGTNIIFRKVIAGTTYDATKALSFTVGTTYKIKWRQSSTFGMDIYVDGAKGTTNANTADMVLGTTFEIGSDGQGGNHDFALHKNVRIGGDSLAYPDRSFNTNEINQLYL